MPAWEGARPPSTRFLRLSGQVLLKGAPPATRAFHDFIVAPAAHAVWQRHGYTPPGA